MHGRSINLHEAALPKRRLHPATAMNGGSAGNAGAFPGLSQKYAELDQSVPDKTRTRFGLRALQRGPAGVRILV